MIKPIAIKLLLGTLLIGTYVLSYGALLQHRKTISLEEGAGSEGGLWNIPKVALLALSGEFKGMVANYLTLEAGAQLGTHVIRDKETGAFRILKKTYDWPNLQKIFVASQILDPSFAQTFLVAQGWLPWHPANMVDETQGILQIADKARPWDWQPAHSMGFNYYYFLNAPGEAGRVFLEAAKRENAPPFLAILGARLATKGGETDSALAIIESVLQNKSEDEPGYQDIVDRFEALKGVSALEKAVKRFQEKFGRIPSDIKELVASGTMHAVPNNPYKVEYCIDREGAVHFDWLDCRKN